MICDVIIQQTSNITDNDKPIISTLSKLADDTKVLRRVPDVAYMLTGLHITGWYTTTRFLSMEPRLAVTIQSRKMQVHTM